jgi:predicted protein tyrosine phosphatase
MQWADIAVFVNPENHERAQSMKLQLPPSVYVLNVPDRYEFRHSELVEAIRAELAQVGFPHYAEQA